jgi:hypothetical protein
MATTNDALQQKPGDPMIAAVYARKSTDQE